MDHGAEGLLLPMVQNVAEAELAVASCRYPPKGIRGFSGSNRANNFGRIKDYRDRVEDETAVLVQVESRAALAVTDQIGAVDGVDGVFFGPGDIAADMGYLGQPMHDAVWEVIRVEARKLIDRGVPVGTLVSDPDFAKALVEEGFTFVACGSDAELLSQGSDALIRKMRD